MNSETIEQPPQHPNPEPVIPEITLDPKQIEAIKLCCDMSARIVCITGAAGSGKTTIMKQVHKALTDAGHNVAVCAPTGKASKRVYEATGIRAQTIHLLLKYTHPGEPDPKTGKVSGISVPRKYQDDPLSENIVIADEYAMVGHVLHRNLANAIPRGGRLIVFGDINQLPPIEEDNLYKSQPSPFKKLMDSYPTVKLDRIHRQGEGSGIVENCSRILKGMTPMNKPDFSLVISEEPIKHLGIVLRRLEEEKGVKFDSVDNQVISPSRKNWVGTAALNGMMQQIFERKSDDSLTLERNTWDIKNPCTVRLGTKIIQVKNDYVLGVYNGETGIVHEMNMDLGSFTVDFGDRYVEYPPSLDYDAFDEETGGMSKRYYNPQKNLELAYALTTHKCQGSEYKYVIYVMNKSMYGIQIRPNFYTGVSRARTHVTLLSDSRSIMSALKRTESNF